MVHNFSYYYFLIDFQKTIMVIVNFLNYYQNDFNFMYYLLLLFYLILIFMIEYFSLFIMVSIILIIYLFSPLLFI